MNAAFATRIELDEQGVAWIGGTKVKVTEIVLDKIAYGWSPEEIHFQHPHLSLAQIHGALTYYYENQSHLDAQIRQRLEKAETLAVQAASLSLSFYMDVHVPRAITTALRLRGIDVLTAQEDGSEDEDLLR